MRIFVSLISMIIASGPALCQTSAPVEDHSIPPRSMPPAIMSVLGQEAREALPDLLPYPADREVPGVDAVRTMLVQLDQAALDTQNKMNGRAAGATGNDGAGQLLELGGAAIRHPAVSVMTVAFSKIITGQAGLQLEREGGRISHDHDRAVRTIVRAAVADANEAAREEWLVKTITPQNSGEAIQDLLGDRNDFFNDYALAGLSESARNALLDARDGILRETLVAYAKMNAAEREAEKVAIRSELDQQRDQIMKMAVIQEEIPRELEAITQITKTELQAAKIEQGLMNDQLGAIQAQMWRGMSERERLSALESGFMPSLSDVDRDGAIKDLRKTVAIMDRRDDVTSKLQYVGQAGAALARMGVPIDAVNLQRNVDTATVAVNLISEVALGNYVGALKSLPGLFAGGAGQGGPDPVLDAKLDRVIALQKETLKKLKEMKAQIQASTDRIVTQLERMDQKLDTIINMLGDAQFSAPLGRCKLFVADAEGDHGMTDGVYPSYEARASHFKDDNEVGGPGHYRECKSFIEQLRLIEPSGRTHGSPGVLHPLFAETSFGDDVEFRGVEPLYKVMLEATWKSLPAAPDAACKDHLLAVLSDAPQRLSSGQGIFSCPEQGSEAVLRKLHSATGRPISAEKALGVYIAPLTLKIMIGYVQFLGPFDDLAIASEGVLVLKSMSVIVTEGIPVNRLSDSAKWTRSYLDHLNVSVSQQVVLSGYYAIPAALRALSEWDFGHRERDRRNPEAMKEDHRCTDKPAWGSFDTYSGWACLLAENPYFLSNTVRYLVVRSLVQSGAGLYDYNKALADRDPGHIIRVLPDLPLKLAADGKTWSLGLLDAAGRPWDIALPSRGEIAADVIAYRVGASDILELREEFLRRHIMQSEAVVDLSEGPDGLLLRRAMIDDASLSAARLVQ